MKTPPEDSLVAALAAQCPPPDAGVLTGIGDDCAVIEGGGGRLLLLKTDCVVEGVHFARDCPPALAGRKALLRVLSDIAAMGGRPGPFLVTAGLGGVVQPAWLEAAYSGIGAAIREFGGSLAGGETTRSPGAGFLSVAMVGGMEDGAAPVPRSGGRPGDALFVTGELGNAQRSGWHLEFCPRLAEAAWLLARHRPTAMMDLSDGLAADLPRLAAASSTGYHIDRKALPLRKGATIEAALCDGEDFELLFAVPAESSARLLADWRDAFPRVRLTRLGELGQPGAADDLGAGFDHLANAPGDAPS